MVSTSLEMLRLAQMCERAYAHHTGVVGEIEYLVEDRTVAIRGTETGLLLSGLGFLDVIRDLRILPWYDRRIGWAHAGMLKGARDLFDHLLWETELLRDCVGDEPPRAAKPLFAPITITGHSLGAGVGLLLAHLVRAFGFPVRFVGFGTPRCMISKPHPNVVATYYRHGDDPFTEVPRWWMGGYRPLPVVQLGYEDGLERRGDHAMRHYVRELLEG